MDFISTMSFQFMLTGGLLVALVLIFLFFFLFRAIAHWFRLRSILKRIDNLDSKNAVAAFKAAFLPDTRLSHLWKEYQDSLHIQREEREGQMVVSATRATVPAETYFNSQYVVDSRLWTEFFKHFPGIYTGIGIIGTFTGLIDGLHRFQVSENAATVRASLESLMHAVGEAFLISAAAIAAAMVVTLLEKLILAALYTKAEAIAHAIDARFDSGAGEEYLSRLVTASEDSASQSKMLKDALVKELGELLRELTQSQIEASKQQQSHITDRLSETARQQMEAARQDNQALGAAIAESIQKSLQGPLEDIAKTVREASGDQSATAAQMLQDVMVSFSQRLTDLFGGQISGLSELNQQTSQGIQNAVSTLQTLVANMEESSRRSTDTMAERMAQSVERMEERQEATNEQSRAFVEQIKQLVATSQSETSINLQATLEGIGTQVGKMLTSLGESQNSVYENNRLREQTMHDRASESVAAMSDSVETAIKEIGAASTQMTKNISILTETTATSIDKMNAGAEQINLASRTFVTAGEKTANILGQVATIATKLSETSGALTAGGAAIQELLRDYRTQRDAIGHVLTELKATVAIAQKEASITGDILNRIQSSSDKLSVAQRQADEYLEGVSRVLGEAHSSFADEVTRTLDRANREFHTKLTSAVAMLSSSISELELTLASAGALTQNKR